jgi:galactokinase/tRNA pseudouridine(38-40) synthase
MLGTSAATSTAGDSNRQLSQLEQRGRPMQDRCRQQSHDIEQRSTKRACVASASPSEHFSGERKTRKVAILFGYLGAAYHGMQVNPGVTSVEGVLLEALEKSGLIPDAKKETLQAVQFCRAARTDKGVSAASQCVSLRLKCEVNGEVDSSLVHLISSHLPDDICLYGMRRATGGFNARSDCHRRRYEYMFPVQVLGGGNGVELPSSITSSGTGCDPRVTRLNEILGKYVGTHCFANFTDGLNAADDAAKRYMIRVEATEPFLPADSSIYFTSVRLYGQSFVLNQIRRMVGLALAVYTGIAPPEAIELALSPHKRVYTPTAPALGLFLDELEFTAYNAGNGKALALPIALDGSMREMKETFKMRQIYPHIAGDELRTNSMQLWTTHLKENSKFDPPGIINDHERYVKSNVGIEDDRRRRVAAHFLVTRHVSEFFSGTTQTDAGASDAADQDYLDRLLVAFKRKHGVSARFVVRAPGRVNLIGEHLDYNGLPVIGCATRQGTMIAGAFASDMEMVEVSHLDSEEFGAGSFDSDGSLRNDTHDIANVATDWIRYVTWGWKAMVAEVIPKKRKGNGGRIVVSGNLPRAAGLGSSSSLVTAAAIMCAMMNRSRRGREEVALIAADGERKGAGTRGGAVDHTVSMTGQKGSAVFVSFSPKLETVSMDLPTIDQGSFVVINSGVHAFKGQDGVTRALFNTRVAECRLAAALAARRLKTHLGNTVSTPGQLYKMARCGGQVSNLGELEVDVRTVLGVEEVVTFAEAVSEIGLSELEVHNRFCTGLSKAEIDKTQFQIGKRMAHVLSEAQRVESFRNLLLNGSGSRDGASTVVELGQILLSSHASLRYQYECSCPEVDSLVSFCASAGAAGSRITGAGWGGCILSIVAAPALDGFVKELRGRVGNDAVFIVEPNAGACVLAL